MIPKETLFVETAKKYGFESKFLCSEPYKYSSKEPLRWLFWLTELQKWFREVHDIHVEIICWKKTKGTGSIFESSTAYEWCDKDDPDGLPENMFSTYEEALEDSLAYSFKALAIKPTL